MTPMSAGPPLSGSSVSPESAAAGALDYRTMPERDLPLDLPLSAVKYLHIEMGYQCNYRCSFCYQVDFSAKQNMKTHIWRERLEKVYPHLEDVFFQGGEPTIIKDCLHFRDFIYEQHPRIRMSLVTNGLRFDKKWAEVFVERGKYVQFSLNAATKESNEKLMVYGKWDPVIANIEHLLRRRDESGSPLAVKCSCVILPENVAEAALLIDMAGAWGMQHVLFQCDRHLSVADRDDARVLRHLDEAYAARDRYPGMLVSGLESFEQMYLVANGLGKKYPDRLQRCQEVRSCTLCRVPWFEIYVRHNGAVFFCCMTYKKVGDLNDEDIEAIWNSADARKFRDGMLHDKYTYCSATCLSNPHPDYSLLKSVSKFYEYMKDDPNLAIQKAQSKVKTIFAGKGRF